MHWDWLGSNWLTSGYAYENNVDIFQNKICTNLVVFFLGGYLYLDLSTDWFIYVLCQVLMNVN